MSWKHALWKYCELPGSFTNVEWFDEHVVVIKDLYPKVFTVNEARYHFLAMPRERKELLDLKRKDSQMLDRLVEASDNIRNKYPKVEFRIGFHAVPSMSQLHLHIISQDFDSRCLKTKQHYLSFTTPFFVHPEEIIKNIEQGRLKGLERELKGVLRCHHCNSVFSNMPRLKAHLTSVVGI
jgi:aprataxin